MKRVIVSLLENDLYKFNMQQVIYHQFPEYMTTWTFKCRNKDVVFTQEMVEEIKMQIKQYCDLRFEEDELQYLNNLKWIKEDYVNFLRLWHPRYEDFKIGYSKENGLEIETYGTWLNTTMYEVPTLAIVNEVYFKMQYDYNDLLESFKEKAENKINWLKVKGNDIGKFSEFGLRRRLSRKAQDYIVKRLKDENNKYVGDNQFVGTSNVYLAKKYDLTPVGTQAHEFIMCVGQGDHKHNPAYSNYFMMQAWVKEYGVLNGIALTDTLTTDLFLKDFDLTFATLFSGVRHDSGDPIEWGEKMINHYNSLGISPKNKTLLFSDNLNFEKALKIQNKFKDETNVAFGIGTYLSNDTKVKPLNIVMKVTEANNGPVAKISDTPGKGMCKDENYVDYLQRTIDWRMKHN